MREPSNALSALFFSVAVAAMAASACSRSNSEPSHAQDAAASGGTALGGNSGLGGAAPTGGAAASGGAPGSGGASARGGSSGSEGTATTGGTASTGGASSVGGTVSAGGSTSAGGRTGTGGTTRTGGTRGAGGTTGQGGDADAATTSEDGAADGMAADAGAVPKDAMASDTAPSTCTASQPAPAAGERTVTMQHGGRSRRYILHVPSGLTTGTALAVVFDLHGAGGSGSQQKGMSGFSSIADQEKFLAIFPDGIDGYWNVDDTCCGTAGKERIDDVGFIRAIIDELSAESCIDAKRIYVSGFSNGGGLAHRMGCDAADIIAAIAPTGTDLRTQPCNAVRPISMMEVRGMADSLEPYEGGLVGPPGGQYDSPGAQGSLALWADINQCTGTPTTIEKYCESYTQCADGVETDLCSLPNVDHSPYGNSLGFNVARVAWSMFKRQPMK
jgi:poly(3-hydroxybutyrate) depolymerase